MSDKTNKNLNLHKTLYNLLKVYKKKNKEYGFKGFIKMDNYSSFIFESKYEKIMNGTRTLNLQNSIINEWINFLEQEFKTRYSATPKNFNWYKENFVFANNNLNYDETCFNPNKETSKCDDCIELAKPKYFPNLDEECVVNFLSRLKKSAYTSKNVKSLKNSRFFLLGRAGEGKTAFINYMLSVKQDFFWKNKLINIKLNFTDDWILTSIKDIINKESEENIISSKINIFIKNLINLKIIRILKTHYFTSETKININEELAEIIEKEIIPNILRDNNLYLERGNSSDSIYSKYSFLIYKNGKMSSNMKDKILRTINISTEWEKYINSLYEKSQFTLTEQDIIDIKISAKNKLNNLDIAQKIANIDLLDNNGLAKNHYISASNEMVLDICNALQQNYGYDLCIIFDGLDAHYNIDLTDLVIDKILFTLINISFQPKDNNKVYGSYIIATRRETMDKYIKNKVFPGTVWDKFQTIELADIPIYDIIYNKLKQTSNNSKNEYYKNFYKNFLNMCTHHININLIDDYQYEKQDIINGSVDLLELNLLFRNNKRKLISFFELYFKEIFFKLEQNYILKFNETNPNKTIDINISNYFNFIKNKSYLFWNPIIYKNYKRNQKLFSYSFTEGIIDRKINQDIDTVTYGHFPNIFSFIDLNEKDLEINNKFFLRLRILQILDNRSQPLKSLIKNLSVYYKINEKEVNWEIDELITIHGVISVEERGNGNHQLKTNKYWLFIKNKMFNRHTLLGLLSIINIPNYNIFNNFLTYVSVNDSKAKFDIKKEDVFFAELISIVYFYAYILHLEDIEKECFFTPNYKSIEKIYNSNQNISFDETFSIAEKIKKILDEIITHHDNIYSKKQDENMIIKIDSLIEIIKKS